MALKNAVIDINIWTALYLYMSLIINIPLGYVNILYHRVITVFTAVIFLIAVQV